MKSKKAEKSDISRVIQISILGKICGNVNADEVIGQRMTIKKMYSSDGETHPFVSARAVKYCIRQALQERGHDIDPFELEGKGKRAVDSGNPAKYTDNDLFGFMRAPRGERGVVAARRQGPIALSYFRALRDTPIKSELGLRTPRKKGQERAILPFEIEVAEFVGRINCLIYDYIGKHVWTEGNVEPGKEFIDIDDRRKRLKDFLEIFMTPAYVLPRRTNSLNIPEYIVALVALSERGPVPIYQYLDYLYENGKPKIDLDKIDIMMKRKELNKATKFLVDYCDAVPQNSPIEVKSLSDVINTSVDFLLPKKRK